MAQSVITQVTRDADSYAPCPPPESIQERGTTHSARNPERSSKPEKMCLCNWILACFKKDEPAVGSTPFSSDSSCSPPTPELGVDKYLLPPVEPGNEDRKCVIIDLDETLVHSSFKPVNNADFIVPVEIDNVVHQVYVLKRPYCDEFLKRMGEMFECVLFTASLAKYADPVSDLLDKYNAFSARLFRESCVFHRGNYVKDLSRLGRDLTKVVIIDNSPQSYIFHPNNAVPVTSWFEDRNDTELLDLIPFFEALDKEDNVVTALSRCHQFQTTPIPMEIETPLATAQRSS